jgi:hypothetical protein
MQSRKKVAARSRHRELLLAEGLAVGALVHSRILLMGAHQNAVQGAVVFAVAVVCALLNSTFDALVGFAVHCFSSFDLGSALVCPAPQKKYGKFFHCLAIKRAW